MNDVVIDVIRDAVKALDLNPSTEWLARYVRWHAELDAKIAQELKTWSIGRLQAMRRVVRKDVQERLIDELKK
jgi:hypothetical protein